MERKFTKLTYSNPSTEDGEIQNKICLELIGQKTGIVYSYSIWINGAIHDFSCLDSFTMWRWLRKVQNRIGIV